MTTSDLKDANNKENAQADDSVSSTTKGSASAKKSSNRTDFIYDVRDRESFYKDLQGFHESRNTPIVRFPKINGKEVDLHKLYAEVVKRGGWLKVNIRNEWDELLHILGINQKCVNAPVAIKHIYTRYLDKYERLHFLGEDPDRADEPDDEGRHKKWSAKNFTSVPMTYNYSQHQVSEPLRVLHRLSTDMFKPSEYDKLMLSLLSPLPNEQDFAINVCTLMANESQHTLKLDHCPKLVDVLIAHAGVFSHFSMRDIFVEMYTKVRRHSLQTFWTDCLYDKPPILELSYDDYFQAPDEKFEDMAAYRTCERLPFRGNGENVNAVDPEEYKNDVGRYDFLCLGRGLGTHDYVGQRVLQVTSIMRNLSFFEENLSIFATNRTFLRFLVMCANVRWGNLHHMAFDIFGNIATQVSLRDPTSDELTRCILTTICEGLEGQDRGVIISCLEILNKLSQKDTNANDLNKCLDFKTYNQICLFLALNDIMLLLYTLECLYGLSSLGPRPCNSIIQVKGIVDTLVSLITVEAQSYGPDGCILMRVVETVPGNMLPMVAQNIANLQNVAMQGHVLAAKKESHPEAAHATATNPEPQKAIVVPPSPSARPNLPAGSKDNITTPATPTTNKTAPTVQESDPFALAWVTATFESIVSPTSRVEQQELYKMYLAACQKAGRRGIVSPIHFPQIVRTVLGSNVGPNLIKTTEANGIELNAFYYINIRMRANPMPVQYKVSPMQAPQANQSPTIQKVITKTPTQSPATQHQVKVSQQALTEAQAIKKPEPQSIAQKGVPQTGATESNQLSVIQHPQQHQQPQMQIQQQPQQVQVSQQIQVQQQQIQLQQHVQMQQQQQVQIQQQPQPMQITPQTPQQISMQSPQIVVNPNNSAIVQGNGNVPQTSSSLIKSLLANKVTTSPTSTSDVSEANASAAPNNPSCLITQNVNLHQVAQRQQMKQKELAQQQAQQQQQSVPHASISALMNNPVIPTSAVKVGQTTIKAISTNAVIPAAVIEKKTTNTSSLQQPQSQTSIDSTDNSSSNWDPVPPLAPLSGNLQNIKIPSNVLITPGNDDSNSTGNNSVASSAISSTQVITTDDGEGSLISFEGLLVPKSKSGSSSVTEDDISKDSFNKTAQGFQGNQMLVDLLDKKSPDLPVPCGPAKRKYEEEPINEGSIIQKRLATDNDEIDDDEEMPIVQASKNAANLYAEMAASILEDEDLEDEPELETTIPVIQPPVEQKQVITMPVPIQRQIIMGPNNQVILTQPGQPVNQPVPPQATATIKTDSGLQTVPLIIQKQIGPNGQPIIQPVIQQQHQHQTQYVLATNPQGQTYLVAQQPQQQQPLNPALLLAQTGQQQGSQTKTIIILQQQGGPPQAVAQQQIISNPAGQQKVIMTTQQGQQMIVTQVPRPVQHHQIIVSNPNSNIMQNGSPQNVIISQNSSMVQQSQMQQQQHIQIQTNSAGQQHLQIQSAQGTQPQIQLQTSVPQPQIQIQSSSASQSQMQIQAPPCSQQQFQIQAASHTVIQKQMHLAQVGGVSVQVNQSPTTIQSATNQPSITIQPQLMQQPASIIQSQGNQQQTSLQTQQQASILSQLPHIPATIKIHPSSTQTSQTQTKALPKPQILVQQQSTIPPVPSQQQSVIQTTRAEVKRQIIVTGSGTIELSENAKVGITAPPQVTSQPIHQGPTSVHQATQPTQPQVNQVMQPQSPQQPSSQLVPKRPNKPDTPAADEETFDQNWLWICDWRGCPRKQYKSLAEVYRHACTVHCPESLDPAAEIYCQWGPGSGLCDNIPRKRYSLMTHLLDRHCTLESLKAACQRRATTGILPPVHGQPVTIIKNVPSNSSESRGTASPALSTSSSSSLPPAASAAMHAIKRHSNDFVNPKELMDENEGPVTKSIRLTAALILRNLVTHTSLAKRNLRCYEPHLAGVALSNVESSRTISQILYELNN
ncbi:AT-rich interactive domain-containing protein 2 isoform X3 [Hermetia illucens]|uniref:AT-rich interactive domain-containing protein 2 isoform X3 n=1 Tax=Hermetia illucens TaxID=343691 RepID=UPI0018CC6B40|nr:AT-rich interactive domain-containing protein 2 isoform X3 [Hermetia illucens]